MRELYAALMAILVVSLQPTPVVNTEFRVQASLAQSIPVPDTRPNRQEVFRLSYERTYTDPFGYVGGIRVLSDGRLIVADPLGQVLVLVDMEEGIADTLGRIGGGPGEYRQPDAVFPLPGDSTLLTDLGNGRLTVISADGVFGESTPIHRELANGSQAIVLPRFVDAAGRIYFQPDNFSPAGPSDSAVVVRYDRSTNVIDTIAAIVLTPRQESRSGSRVMIRRRPLLPRDDWAVGPSGKVAIIRGMDYSVEWIGVDGRRQIGSRTSYEPVRVGNAEKEEWIANAAIENINIGMMRSASGERTIQFSRGGGGRRRDIADYDWPDVLPPIRYRRVRVSPDGLLWIERYVRAGDPPTIDIFDDSGSRIGSFALPIDRKVGAIGDQVVILVHTDEDGLNWLERHRLSSY